MGDQILLALLVLIGTAIWPLNRWAMMRQARTEYIGIALTVVLAVGSVIVSILMGKPLVAPAGILWGSVAGIAYAVGFILIIFYCLKIGPSGPTVTINNMGLLWPVVLDLALFRGAKAIPSVVWIGLAATVLALVLMGWGHGENHGATPVTKKWAILAMVGWVFSGTSMGSQFLSSHYAPDAPFTFSIFLGLVALVILTTIALVKRGGRIRREELIAGSVTGLMMVVAIPLTLILLTRVSSAIVFPLTVAGPAVLMLLIGHFLLEERLSAVGWVASLLGVAGIVLLSLR